MYGLARRRSRRRREPHIPPLPHTNLIKATVDCTMCLKEKASCREIQFGITEDHQLQVWCNRHSVTIMMMKLHKRRKR